MAFSVNHIPPGPAVMSVGLESWVMPALNAVAEPAGVIRPTAPGLGWSANQTLPSAPAASPTGPAPAANSVIVGAAMAALVHEHPASSATSSVAILRGVTRPWIGVTAATCISHDAVHAESVRRWTSATHSS
uniref:hypothetical protein n=1 Tax=Baekduia soli TaxID=496014 RepID=UPI001651DAE2|nr:hypothetical protein [Baekduia soli]